MRNLKRVLSLALALVMVLGMMVITTSAATFDDDAEITQKEAVEVMYALGIVQGDGTGSFNPDGTFTRAGAAKVLAYMMLGADYAEKNLIGTAIFADVPEDHWAAKYIAYCSNLEIIKGDGTGNFLPNGTLRVVDWAKLVLGAIGYDAAKYTGNGWEQKVKDDIEAAELDVVAITTLPISRENACWMALEAMKEGEKYSNGWYIKDYEELGYSDSYADAYIMAKTLEIPNFDPKTDLIEDKGTKDSLLEKVYGVTYVEDDTDPFGNPGVGYEKKDEDGEYVIDLFYGEKATLTYTATEKAKDIKADLEALKVTDAEAEAAELAELTGDNKVVKVYVEKKAVTLVTVEETVADVVEFTEADEEKEEAAYITVAGADKYETEEFVTGDVVLYTVGTAGEYEGKIQEIAKAEYLTGKLTGYTKDGKFTVNGKAYELSEIALIDEDDMIAAMGKEKVYALDANGKVVGFVEIEEEEGPKEEAPVITDYAIVKDVYAAVKNETKAAEWPSTEKTTTTTVTAKIQVLLSNATEEIWEVAVVKADKDIKKTDVKKGDYYFCVGDEYVVVDLSAAAGEEDKEAGTANLTAELEALKGVVYTYADKALVAPVADVIADEEKDAIVVAEFGAEDEIVIDAKSYVVDGVILNDKTVFLLHEVNEDDEVVYILKTGLAALESTEIDAGYVLVDYTAGKDKDGEYDADASTLVATLVIAYGTEFEPTVDEVKPTEDYVLVDANYAVSVDGDYTVYTYDVVYADGTTGTVSVKYEEGEEVEELAAGVYKLNSDGTVGAEPELDAEDVKTVKVVSGTTVVFADGAMTTNAKTVVIGGELKAGAKAYVIGEGVISLAFIVE